MLYSIHQKIIQLIKEAFHEFGLKDTCFGLKPYKNQNPYFTIEEQNFQLKVPLLKKPIEKVNIASDEPSQIKFSDRFELQFQLKVYEKDPIKRETYVMLVIPALWGDSQELFASPYHFRSGALKTEIQLSDLSFLGQVTKNETSEVTVLSFLLSGMVHYSKLKPNESQVIEKVLLEHHHP